MLAIVIPYYNYDYFEYTLASLSNQTDKRFKVYVGNDCSPNNPEALLNKYKTALNIEYTIFDVNFGKDSLVKQWERCIALTKDENWLILLGDDDVLDVNFVAAFYKNIDAVENSGSTVIRYASQYIDEKGTPLKKYPLYKHPTIEKATDAFYRNAVGESRSSLSEHIFSKKMYLDNRFIDYPLAWHSDDYAWLVFSGFNTIYTINESVVSVRVSSISITGKKDNIIPKLEATKQFYTFLIRSALHHFSKEQQVFLLLKYVEVLKTNKSFTFGKTISIMFKLFATGAFVSGLKVLNRFIRS